MVERRNKPLDLVPLHSILHDFCAMWVEVVGPDEDLLFACGYGEWTDTCHHITDHLTRIELVHQPAMFRLQTAVPVDAGVIKAELAFLLVNGDVGVVVAGEQLEGESTEFRMRADIFDFVDDRADALVLVFEDFGNQVFVGEILFAEVKVDCLLILYSKTFDGNGQHLRTCPTCVNPWGISSCISSGRIASIISAVP